MITWTWRLLPESWANPALPLDGDSQRLDRLRTVKQKRRTWYKPCVPLDFPWYIRCIRKTQNHFCSVPSETITHGSLCLDQGGWRAASFRDVHFRCLVDNRVEAAGPW